MCVGSESKIYPISQSRNTKNLLKTAWPDFLLGESRHVADHQFSLIEYVKALDKPGVRDDRLFSGKGLFEFFKLW